jgi:hypothetical protein
VVLATQGPSDLEAGRRALLPQVLQDTAWQLAFRHGSPQDARHMEALSGHAYVEDPHAGLGGETPLARWLADATPVREVPATSASFRWQGLPHPGLRQESCRTGILSDRIPALTRQLRRWNMASQVRPARLGEQRRRCSYGFGRASSYSALSASSSSRRRWRSSDW